MQSATSFFNKTIIVKNIKRFWPVWTIYLIAWTIGMPIVISSLLSRSTYSAVVSEDVLENALYMGTVMSFIFGVASALCLFSYLYSARSAGAFHSLPIRREGLFVSNFVSGIVWLLASNVVIFLLSLTAELIYGSLALNYLLQWLGMVSLESLFFFGFGVFCAMLTGHGFALPVIYGVLNFAVVVIEMILRYCTSLFSYGITGSGPAVLSAFSPAYMLLIKTRIVGYYPISYMPSGPYEFIYTGWTTLIIYGVMGLIFAAVALLLYRRRQSESASEFIAAPALRPVFKYFFAFIGSLVLGMLFYTVIFEASGYNAAGSALPMLICMVVGGFFGYFITAMLLKKSFRVFGKAYKGFLLYVLALLAFIGAFEFDLFGIERYVPDPDEVSSLTVQAGYSLKFDDAGSIISLEAVHKSIIGGKREHENLLRQYGRYYYPGGTLNVAFRYTLKNGRQILRRYNLYAQEPDQSLIAELQEALNSAEAISDRLSELLDVSAADVETIAVEYMKEGMGYEREVLTRETLAALLSSLKADILDGNIGRIPILDNSADENAIYDCNIAVQMKDGSYVSVYPNKVSKNTLAFLNSIGINPLLSEYLKYPESYFS